MISQCSMRRSISKFLRTINKNSFRQNEKKLNHPNYIDIAAHFIQFVFVFVVKNIQAWPLQNAVFTMMLGRYR